MKIATLISLIVLSSALGVGCRTSADVRQDDVITNLSKNVENIQKNRADSSMNVEDMRAELLTLKGKIEETNYRQKQTQDYMEKLVASIDERLKAMDEKISKRHQEKEKDELAPSKKSEPKAKGDAADAEAHYSKGLAAFETNDFKTAAKHLEEFMDSKPKGPKASAGAFMLGQAYQKTKDYARAIDIYQTIREQYPKYSRIPDVIMAQAESFFAMGEKDTSKLFYSEVVEKFPQSVQARAAKKALGKFK